jgi:hypothetical protein
MKISILDDYHDTLRTWPVSASSTDTTSRSGTIACKMSISFPNALGIRKLWC